LPPLRWFKVPSSGGWTSFVRVRLADPCGLLQGDRVSKRFVPIGSVADAERPEIVALIRAAAALDPTEWTSAWGHKERYDPNQIGTAGDGEPG
jgi:hypothetical protein